MGCLQPYLLSGLPFVPRPSADRWFHYCCVDAQLVAAMNCVKESASFQRHKRFADSMLSQQFPPLGTRAAKPLSFLVQAQQVWT
jgi:hypothetical protein